jgi:hypothetical protein
MSDLSLKRVVFVVDNTPMIANVKIEDRWLDALMLEMDNLPLSFGAEALPIRLLSLSEPCEVDHGFDKAMCLLETLAEEALGAEPDGLGILENWAPEARDFDSAVRAARPGESLQTLTLMFTRDLGGADDRLYEMDVVVPERAVEKCQNWINELIVWLEDEGYGYAVTSWIRENESSPHTTVGTALNDLVAQMVAADLSSHPWTEMLRSEMRVAQAQKRVDNTPGWEMGSQEGPRRARPRP